MTIDNIMSSDIIMVNKILVHRCKVIIRYHNNSPLTSQQNSIIKLEALVFHFVSLEDHPHLSIHIISMLLCLLIITVHQILI